MNAQRLHLRYHPGSGYAACGRFFETDSAYVAVNPEAVNCGNCLRTNVFIDARRMARR